MNFTYIMAKLGFKMQDAYLELQVLKLWQRIFLSAKWSPLMKHICCYNFCRKDVLCLQYNQVRYIYIYFCSGPHSDKHWEYLYFIKNAKNNNLIRIMGILHETSVHIIMIAVGFLVRSRLNFCVLPLSLQFPEKNSSLEEIPLRTRVPTMQRM